MAAKQKDKKDTRADKAISPQVVLAEVYKLQAAVENDYQSLTEPLKEDIEAHVHIQTAWMEHSPLSLAGGVILSLMRALIAGKKTNIPLLTGMRQGEASFSYGQHVQTITGLAALDLIVTPKKAEMLDKHWAECKQIIAAGYGSAETIKLPEAPVEALFVNHYLRICEAAVDFYMANGSPSTPEEAKAMFETFVELYLSWIPELQMLGHLSSVIPTNHVIPDNKLANKLPEGIVDAGAVALVVSRSRAKKPVETICVLTYEGDNVNLSGKQAFTEYDRNVYNAVCSLYVYGDPSHVFTPAMVYRAMTGLAGSEKPTAGQTAAVTRSLEKMRFIRAVIDCTEELKMRRITINSQQIRNGEVNTYLLAAESIKVRGGGQTLKAYKLIRPPILYEYAAFSNQVLTVPASMLEIKEINKDGSLGARLPNTISRIVIKGRIMRRIEGLKSGKMHQPVVALYDYERDGEMRKGLYALAGKPEPSWAESKRIRDDIQKMLDYWKATGYIKGYEAQKKRNTITGYKLIV